MDGYHAHAGVGNLTCSWMRIIRDAISLYLLNIELELLCCAKSLWPSRIRISGPSKPTTQLPLSLPRKLAMLLTRNLAWKWISLTSFILPALATLMFNYNYFIKSGGNMQAEWSALFWLLNGLSLSCHCALGLCWITAVPIAESMQVRFGDDTSGFYFATVCIFSSLQWGTIGWILVHGIRKRFWIRAV